MPRASFKHNQHIHTRVCMRRLASPTSQSYQHDHPRKLFNRLSRQIKEAILEVQVPDVSYLQMNDAPKATIKLIANFVICGYPGLIISPNVVTFHQGPSMNRSPFSVIHHPLSSPRSLCPAPLRRIVLVRHSPNRLRVCFTKRLQEHKQQ